MKDLMRLNIYLANSSKARTKLNWQPEHTFKDLVEMMVDSDLEEAKRESVLINENLIKPTWEHPTT